MSYANRPSMRVGDFHDIARLRIAPIRHVAGKNPGMPVGSPVDGFSIYTNCGQAAILARK